MSLYLVGEYSADFLSCYIKKVSVQDNRKRSNVIETILRKHFGLSNRKQKAMARGIS